MKCRGRNPLARGCQKWLEGVLPTVASGFIWVEPHQKNLADARVESADLVHDSQTWALQTYPLQASRILSDNPQQHRRRPQLLLPSTTQQSNQNGSRRWSSCGHSRTFYTEGIDLGERRRAKLFLDVKVLTNLCNTVCLLAGFPQEGYDRPVDLPPTVQVCRLPRPTERLRAGDI